MEACEQTAVLSLRLDTGLCGKTQQIKAIKYSLSEEESLALTFGQSVKGATYNINW